MWCRFLQQLLSWIEESEGRDGAERKISSTQPRSLNFHFLSRRASSFGSVEDDRSSRPEC